MKKNSYIFKDAEAQKYYETLFEANGKKDLDTQKIYEIPLDTFKEAIDTYIVNMKKNELWSRLPEQNLLLSLDNGACAPPLIPFVSQTKYADEQE
jgi:hypothetical protein